MIFIEPSIKQNIENKHPNILPLISETQESDTVVFIVSDIPSPYVDNHGKMFLSESDFDNLMPFIMEFFSSNKRGIPINEAFNTLIGRLTGE